MQTQNEEEMSLKKKKKRLWEIHPSKSFYFSFDNNCEEKPEHMQIMTERTGELRERRVS